MRAVGGLHERRRAACRRRSGERRDHCQTPSAVTTPISSRPSSGRASWKPSMPPKILPTLPTSTQLALPSNHSSPSTLDPRADALDAEVPAPGPDVRERDRSGPSARRRRRGSSRASKPAPAITAKRSPLIRPDVERAARAVEADARPRAARSFGMPRFDASRLAVPAGRIAMRRVGAGERVDAALHHAVAAPDEHQVGAGLERLAPASAPSALRHLVPERVDDAARPAPRAARRGRRRRTCPNARRLRRRSQDGLLHGQLLPAARDGDGRTDDERQDREAAQRAEEHRAPRRRWGSASPR